MYNIFIVKKVRGEPCVSSKRVFSSPLVTDQGQHQHNQGRPLWPALIIYLNLRLFEDSCDARKSLSFESLKHSTTTGTYITYLLSEAHLSNGSH